MFRRRRHYGHERQLGYVDAGALALPLPPYALLIDAEARQRYFAALMLRQQARWRCAVAVYAPLIDICCAMLMALPLRWREAHKVLSALALSDAFSPLRLITPMPLFAILPLIRCRHCFSRRRR